MSAPVLRRAGPADDAAIRRLLALAYPDNVKAAAAFTRWQYWDNPFGATISWVWASDGEVLAHWAAVPVPLVLDGRAVIGAKGVDVATHPDHRGRGLFSRLAQRLTASLAEEGVPALLSHPNPASLAGMTGAGLASVARVPVYALPVDDAWLGRRLRLPAPAAAVARRLVFPAAPARETAQRLASFPDDVGALWDEVSHSVAWGVRRDASWWRWRYAQRPERPYVFHVLRRGDRLAGVAVTAVREVFGGRFLSVLELLALDPVAAGALTASMCAAARDDAAVGVVLATTHWSRTAALARSAGFRRVPRVLEPRPLRFLVAAPGGDSRALARRRWAMSWGDLDHL